jgi:hypothetical protein
MTPREPLDALRNMSAPPRSTLTLRPFQVPLAVPRRTDRGAPSNWGLAWYARVDLDQILQARWPDWSDRLGDIVAPCLGNLRLRGALALARACTGTPDHPGTPDLSLHEDRADELLRRVRMLVPEPALPALMLATQVSPRPRFAERDPARTLAILTHLSGRTCDLGASPLLSEALLEGRPVDLWIAEAAHA